MGGPHQLDQATRWTRWRVRATKVFVVVLSAHIGTAARRRIRLRLPLTFWFTAPVVALTSRRQDTPPAAEPADLAVGAEP